MGNHVNVVAGIYPDISDEGGLSDVVGCVWDAVRAEACPDNTDMVRPYDVVTPAFPCNSSVGSQCEGIKDATSEVCPGGPKIDVLGKEGVDVGDKVSVVDDVGSAPILGPCPGRVAGDCPGVQPGKLLLGEGVVEGDKIEGQEYGEVMNRKRVRSLSPEEKDGKKIKLKSNSKIGAGKDPEEKDPKIKIKRKKSNEFDKKQGVRLKEMIARLELKKS